MRRKLFGHGVTFDYGEPSPAVAYAMLRLLFSSPLTAVGFTSLREDKVLQDRGVRLTVKRGGTALLLFPWLTLHELTHILTLTYSRSRVVNLAAPFLLHLFVLVYLVASLFLSLMFQNWWADALLLFMIGQQIALLLGCSSDLAQIIGESR